MCLSFPAGVLGLFLSCINRVKLRMLFSVVLGGGRTVSTWSCVSNCGLRKKTTQHIKFLPGDLLFALVLKSSFRLSVRCLTLFPPPRPAVRARTRSQILPDKRKWLLGSGFPHSRSPHHIIVPQIQVALLYLTTLYSLPCPCKPYGCSERKRESLSHRPAEYVAGREAKGLLLNQQPPLMVITLELCWQKGFLVLKTLQKAWVASMLQTPVHPIKLCWRCRSCPCSHAGRETSVLLGEGKPN